MMSIATSDNTAATAIENNPQLWLGRDSIRLLDLLQDRAVELSKTMSWEFVHAGVAEIRELARCASDFVGAIHTKDHHDPLLHLTGSIRHAQTLLRAVAGPRLEISYQLPDSTAMTRIPFVAFEQILINLTSNARAAGAQSLRIELEARPYSVVDDLHSCDEGFATLTFADDGPGISEAMVEAVTNQFFSNEDPEWFGEGLRTVSHIADEANGYLGLWNNPEGGLVAVVRLPIAQIARPPEPHSYT